MKCIVCGNASWRFLYPAKDRMFRQSGLFSEYQCTACGFVRLNPQPSVEELNKYYPSQTYYSYNAAAKQSFFGVLRRYLITHPLPGGLLQVPAMPGKKAGKILDIGCGSGDTLSILKDIGWDVYGMDIDKHAIAAAKKRGLGNVALGTYKDIARYPDNYFDAIRMYHVIEHLDDPGLCVRLARRKLRKGGELIIGTPNIDSLVAKLFRSRWYNLDAPRHLFLFTPKTLCRIIKKNGYSNISVSFMSAGGWVGSIQYALSDVLSNHIDLINRPWLIMLAYPLERFLDAIGVGDVVVVRARR